MDRGPVGGCSPHRNALGCPVAVSASSGRQLRLRLIPQGDRWGEDPDENLDKRSGLTPELIQERTGREPFMTAEAPQRPRGVHQDRRIPTWAAGLLALLARDRPPVLTKEDVGTYLDETESLRGVDSTVRELQRLGWLAPLHLKGVWAFVPPGENVVLDRYIDLRGWKARDRDAVFALAGEAAAWHLGYLDRAFSGPVAVWIPEGSQAPHGLRAHLSIVTLGWSASDADLLGPTTRLLHRRRLDTTSWAGGLPGLGPEALVGQLASRPSSFRAWADLVPHLSRLAEDCDQERLLQLIGGKSSSTWQRAAYLLYRGGRQSDGVEILDRRPHRQLAKVQFGTGPASVWVPQFQVADRLIAPLTDAAGKA